VLHSIIHIRSSDTTRLKKGTRSKQAKEETRQVVKVDNSRGYQTPFRQEGPATKRKSEQEREENLMDIQLIVAGMGYTCLVPTLAV
jgi:hypothetical protein